MDKLTTVETILEWKGHEVFAISQDATVFEALERMRDKNVGALLVYDGDRLLGTLSERDYARKVAVEGRNSRQTAVREILSADLRTVGPRATVQECMALMAAHRIRHLPVLEAGAVVGVISMSDLVKWVIQAQSATIDQLQSYISGSYPG